LKQSLEDEQELFCNKKLSAAKQKYIELGNTIVKMTENTIA
jgi:hypothetical protein